MRKRTLTIGNVSIECEYYDQRNGFGHKAELFVFGGLVDTARCQYDNRTWERFPYDSVAKKLIRETKKLNEAKKQAFLSAVAGL